MSEKFKSSSVNSPKSLVSHAARVAILLTALGCSKQEAESTAECIGDPSSSSCETDCASLSDCSEKQCEIYCEPKNATAAPASVATPASAASSAPKTSTKTPTPAASVEKTEGISIIDTDAEEEEAEAPASTPNEEEEEEEEDKKAEENDDETNETAEENNEGSSWEKVAGAGLAGAAALAIALALIARNGRKKNEEEEGEGKDGHEAEPEEYFEADPNTVKLKNTVAALLRVEALRIIDVSTETRQKYDELMGSKADVEKRIRELTANPVRLPTTEETQVARKTIPHNDVEMAAARAAVVAYEAYVNEMAGAKAKLTTLELQLGAVKAETSIDTVEAARNVLKGQLEALLPHLDKDASRLITLVLQGGIPQDLVSAAKTQDLKDPRVLLEIINEGKMSAKSDEAAPQTRAAHKADEDEDGNDPTVQMDSVK